MDEDMDSMETIKMGSAHYANETYAYILLATIGIILIALSLAAWSFRLTTKLRLRAKAHKHRAPASTTWLYTIVSILRESSYGQIRVRHVGLLPSSGIILLSGLYISILITCLLSDIWAPRPVFWEAIALRSGYLAVAQLSLLVAISAKKNLLALLTHTSHERIIVFHRLVAICVLITATLHMGYFLREWLYYDVWKSQWQEMGASMLQWGFAAWGIMIFTLVTSLPIIRAKFYEIWICLHIVSMISLFAMVYMHLDPPYRGWIYAPIAIWVFDRVWRFGSRLHLNADPRQRTLYKARATVEALTGNVTKVTVRNFAMSRSPGQFAYLSIYSLGLNSHPFTIISSPESPDLVFMMKAKGGLTHMVYKKAALQLPPNNEVFRCSVEGPYGGSHIKLQAFDTVFLVAGGIGATFAISLLKELVCNPGCCRRARFVWAVKSSNDLTWLSDELAECVQHANQNRLFLEIEIYVTCDEGYVSMTQPQQSKKTCGNAACRCRSIITQSDITPAALQPEDTSLVAEVEEKTLTQSTVSRVEKSSKGCCCSRRLQTKSALDHLQFAGRPDLYNLISKDLNKARGESAVIVCGPESMTLDIRRVVVKLSDDRAVKKGTGAEAIYLHVENQTSI